MSESRAQKLVAGFVKGLVCAVLCGTWLLAVAWMLSIFLLPLFYLARAVRWPAWLCFLPASLTGLLLLATAIIRHAIESAHVLNEDESRKERRLDEEWYAPRRPEFLRRTR